MPNDLLSSTDAARLLGVKAQTLYAYVSRGKLTAVHASGARGARYWRSEVESLKLRGRGRTPDVVKSALSYGAPLLDSAITHLDVQRGPLYRGRAAIQEY